MTLILLAISLTLAACLIAYRLAIYALPVMAAITAAQYTSGAGAGVLMSGFAAIAAAFLSIALVIAVLGFAKNPVLRMTCHRYRGHRQSECARRVGVLALNRRRRSGTRRKTRRLVPLGFWLPALNGRSPHRGPVAIAPGLLRRAPGQPPSAMTPQPIRSAPHHIGPRRFVKAAAATFIALLAMLLDRTSRH